MIRSIFENSMKKRARINRDHQELFDELFDKWRLRIAGDDRVEAVDWDGVMAALDDYPQLARCKGDDGMTLLHIISALQPPLRVVHKAHTMNSSAINTRSRTAGLLPLMIACGQNSPPEVIRYLVATSMDPAAAIRAADYAGFCPIHWSCREDVSAEVLKTLLCCDPSLTTQPTELPRHGFKVSAKPLTALDSLTATRIPTGSQWTKVCYLLKCRHHGTMLDRSPQMLTAVHAAFALHDISTNLRNAVVAKYGSSAAGVLDQHRMLPLHYAVRQKNCAKSIQVLLAAFPAAANCKDKDGVLPLHAALRSGYSWSQCIRALYECDRRAVTECGGACDMRSPVFIAAQNCDVVTIFALIQENPNAILIK